MDRVSLYFGCSHQVLVQVVGGVVVGGKNVEGVAINFHVASDGHVCGSDERHALVNILVLSLVQELAFDDTTVLLSRLIDANVVISQVERDDKSAVDILGHTSIELGGEAQDFLVVVHGLEEVNLGLLWDQLVHLTKSVLFVTETVVGWRHRLHWLGRLLELHLAKREIVSVVLSVELLREGIHTVDDIDAAIGVDVRCWGDLVAGEVVIADEVLAWLVNIETVWELLSSKQHGKGVSTVVGVMALANLKRVVCQVVVHDVGQVVAGGEETKNTAVIVQELLLRLDFAASKAFLHEVSHFRVVDSGLRDLGLLEVISRGSRCRWKCSPLALYRYKAFEVR